MRRGTREPEYVRAVRRRKVDPDNVGFVSILFLDEHGRLKGRRTIQPTYPRGTDARFGAAVVSPGDLDRDGVPNLLVGSPGWDRGTIWALMLNDH